jgi:tetratricopeptide (TPR) repeat protein
MHDAAVAFKILRLFEPKNWRAACAFLKALWAHRKGDYQAAIAQFERATSLDRLRSSEHMAFYALLMALNKRPAEEGLKMFTRVAAGEFRREADESRYAEAFAHYWIAFLTGRADVMERWLDAFKLEPTKGLAARELPLPDNPIDPAERQGKVILQ